MEMDWDGGVLLLLVYLNHVEDLPSGPSPTSVAQARYRHVMLQVFSRPLGPYYPHFHPLFYVLLLFCAAYWSAMS